MFNVKKNYKKIEYLEKVFEADKIAKKLLVKIVIFSPSKTANYNKW